MQSFLIASQRTKEISRENSDVLWRGELECICELTRIVRVDSSHSRPSKQRLVPGNNCNIATNGFLEF
ncbi:hypothetical protein Ae201684_016993 [Aphanomyces euteiches]|uniref:Uncharacterized protein n=1 Tax=Aphanomyces euteiches TaxID=100861 RepID=A0A6G0WDD3_9STRA|nr:hypothetical protein Ae201684_016993 [Aphanomyces euteiches]